MSKPTSQEAEQHQRLVQQIRELFPAVLTLKPAQFASLAGKDRVWAYRRIWASDVKALGTNDKMDSQQQYQILIEEAADYFVKNSRYISKLNNEQHSKFPPDVAGGATGKDAPPPVETDRVYLVTLLDLADTSTLIQYVRARNGQEAGNYALCLDELGEEREEGYRVISVVSLQDLNGLAQDASSFPGKAVGTLTPLGDRRWARGALISD